MKATASLVILADMASPPSGPPSPGASSASSPSPASVAAGLSSGRPGLSGSGMPGAPPSCTGVAAPDVRGRRHRRDMRRVEDIGAGAGCMGARRRDPADHRNRRAEDGRDDRPRRVGQPAGRVEPQDKRLGPDLGGRLDQPLDMAHGRRADGSLDRADQDGGRGGGGRGARRRPGVGSGPLSWPSPAPAAGISAAAARIIRRSHRPSVIAPPSQDDRPRQLVRQTIAVSGPPRALPIFPPANVGTDAGHAHQTDAIRMPYPVPGVFGAPCSRLTEPA